MTAAASDIGAKSCEGLTVIESIEPILSVVVINWNGQRFLPRCFESLADQTLRGFQTVLVDNGSTDDSVAWTRREYPEVEIIELGTNYGYAEANNRAAAACRGKYLLFLNNDTHLDPRALAALVEAAESDPHAAILAPQQRTYDGAELLNIGLGIDVLGFPCRGKVFYSDGASLFIRRDLFNELGGFDSQYFIFFEENDLCWRARLRGYTVVPVPQATVYHMAGGTEGSTLSRRGDYTTSARRRYLGHRNQLATLLKNYSAPALCLVLPLFAGLTAAEIALLIATGQRSIIRESYLPAWRDLLRNRSHIRTMRRSVQASRIVSDWVILRQMEPRIAVLGLFFRFGVPRVST